MHSCLPCPCCAAALTPGRFGPLAVALCLPCGGALVAAQDLVALARAGRSRLARLASALSRGRSVPVCGHHVCPHCAGAMTEAQSPSIPGVWFRWCETCRCFWATGAQIGAAAGVVSELPAVPTRVLKHSRADQPAPSPAAPLQATAAAAFIPVDPFVTGFGAGAKEVPGPSLYEESRSFPAGDNASAGESGLAPAKEPWRTLPAESPADAMPAEVWQRPEASRRAEAVCPHCTQSGDPGLPACGHCGAIRPGEPAGICPACEGRRRCFSSDRVEFSCCERCGGIWLERGRLPALMRQDELQRSQLAAGLRRRRFRAAPPAALCPSCALLLHDSRADPAGKIKTGACPRCQGAFLNLDQFTELLGYAAMGAEPAIPVRAAGPGA